MKKQKNILLVLLILFISLLIIFGNFLKSKNIKKANLEIGLLGRLERIQSKPERLKELFTNLKVYNSKKLGVKVFYDPVTAFDVREIKNKIYVDYNIADGHIDGQYVEIFKKDSNQSLVDAIKGSVLIGYALDKCNVIVYNDGNNQEIIARIIDNTLKYADDRTICPAEYLSGDFYYNSNHPDKFMFYNDQTYSVAWYVEFND